MLTIFILESKAFPIFPKFDLNAESALDRRTPVLLFLQLTQRHSNSPQIKRAAKPIEPCHESLEERWSSSEPLRQANTQAEPSENGRPGE